MSASHTLLPLVNEILIDAKRFLDEKKYDIALHCYNDALAIDETNLDALMGRYKTYQQKGPAFAKEAKADLETSLNLKRKLKAEQQKQEQEKKEQADKNNYIQQYINAFKLKNKTFSQSKLPEIRKIAETRLLAKTALTKKDFLSTIKLNTLVLEKNTLDADARFDRGTAHFNLKQLPQSLTDFNLIIKENSKNLSAYLSRANIHYEMQAFNKAKSDLIEIFKIDFLRSMQLPDILILVKQLNKKMINKNDAYPLPISGLVDGGYYLEAINCESRKDTKTTIQFYHRAIDQTLNYIMTIPDADKYQTKEAKHELKNLVNLFLRIANKYFLNKDYQSAMFYFSLNYWINIGRFCKIIREEFNPVYTLQYLSYCHAFLGEIEAASHTQIEAEKFRNSMETASEMLKKSYGSAIISIAQLRHNFSHLLLRKAREELAQEHFELAEICLTHSLQFVKNAEIYIDLSVTLRQLNKIKEAGKSIQIALAMEPNNQRAIINSQQIKALLATNAETKQEPSKSKKRKSTSHKKIKQSLSQPIIKTPSNTHIMAKLHAKELKMLEEGALLVALENKEKIRIATEQLNQRNLQKREKRHLARRDALQEKIVSKQQEIKDEKPIPTSSELKPITKIILTDIEKYYLEKLSLVGAKSYLVGSSVRHKITGVQADPRCDTDIVTFATEEMIRKAFPNVYPNPNDPTQFTIYENGFKVDIRQIISLEKHVQNLNFTICTLFSDIEGNVLDLLEKGMQDLTHKDGAQLVTVTSAEESFKDDPLRMIQALYLHVTTPAIISPQLMSDIKRCIPLLTKKSAPDQYILNPNRLHSWLLKLLTHKPRETFEKMIEWGILDQLFREIAPQLKIDKEWIIAELKQLETRILLRNYLILGIEITRNDTTKQTLFNQYTEQLKQNPPVTPNDLYSIFLISETKQKTAHYEQFPNPIREVINNNTILEKYYDQFTPSSRILNQTSSRWNLANSKPDQLAFELPQTQFFQMQAQPMMYLAPGIMPPIHHVPMSLFSYPTQQPAQFSTDRTVELKI